MKKYELLYILPGQFDDTEIGGLMKDVAGMVEAEAAAKISRNESLGKIKLAYPIGTVQHGTYVLVHFEGDPAKIAALDRALRLKDEVLRHTIVDMPAGAEDRTFELSAYVPPMSDEARDTRRPKRTERKDRPAAALPAPAPAVADETSTMTTEELDKKLDEILDKDVTENA